MELRHLRYFVAVAEAGSFRRAAEELHIAQPALSRQVATLESDVGVALFEPDSRRRALSLAGEAFLKDARDILASLDQAVARAQTIARGKHTRLRIAFTEIASDSTIISSFVQALRQIDPALEMTMLPMPSWHQIDALQHGRIDAGFLYRLPEMEPDISFQAMADDPILAVMPRNHPLAGRTKLLRRDFEGQKIFLVARSVRTDLHHSAVAAFRNMASPPQIEEAGSAATVASLVSVGMGIGLLTSTMKSRLPHGLVMRRVADMPLKASFGFAWLTNHRIDVLNQAISLIQSMVSARTIVSRRAATSARVARLGKRVR